ncbi:MAG: DUF4159 domain-containing protein [Hyphomicrobiaceae bacterium]
MMLGSIGFLSPALLAGLIALPVIWWLLRATPPAPQRIHFPATRILKGLRSREQTPARSPWWLTLIRMAAAAAVILALAEPVLNPTKGVVAGTGPLVVVVDNGWGAAAHWQDRGDMLKAVLSEAAHQSRPVMLVPTADVATLHSLTLESAKAASDRSQSLAPRPWPSDRTAAAEGIRSALAGESRAEIFWLSDGLENEGGTAFASALADIAGGERITLVEPGRGLEPIGVRLVKSPSGGFEAEVVSPGGAAREGTVVAMSSRGQPLGEAAFRLPEGARSAPLAFDMPIELRNQVGYLAIAGERSAGAVHLLDSAARWNRIGLVSGASFEKAQPLLSYLYYVERALGPYAQLMHPNAVSTDDAIAELIREHATVLVFADIGKLVGRSLEDVTRWVEGGGVLVRFAGPHLEQGGDELIPVPLRFGGRTLGGALSWSEPQALAPFEDGSPFAGLEVSSEVKVSRQVLADPALMDDRTEVWARLADGTPLVTAAKRKSGWLILFHVTANADWSNLPLSGLFVEMLQRVAGLTGLAEMAGRIPAGGTEGAGASQTPQNVLAPVEALDGFGAIGLPLPTARPIEVAALSRLSPDAEHPPGLYGEAGRLKAINIAGGPVDLLAPLAVRPPGALAAVYRTDEQRPLKPALILAALALLFLDVIAVVAMNSGLWSGRRRGQGAATAAVALLAWAAALALPGGGLPLQGAGLAAAQTAGEGGAASSATSAADQAAGTAAPARVDDGFALKASIAPRLGYVLTGDPATDETSRLGLSGLGRMLTLRTAFEPAEPIGLDVERDELGFFPVLYWPILSNAPALSEAARGKVDAFMREGGLIVFDTRDAGEQLPSIDPSGSPSTEALRRVIGPLDIPRLEPVPPDHVVTKSFYILRTFPGRFDNGQMWVEAEAGSETSDARRPRRADGVSSLVITANDLAGAWAMDELGRPVFACVPGGEEQREWAYRVGVNLVMYALTGNYKADQVHVPALLERLGQ